jgi:hypothetical protein
VRWNRRTKLLSAVAATGVYFLVAHWLQLVYVPPAVFYTEPNVAGEKMLLRRPFGRFLSSETDGRAYWAVKPECFSCESRWLDRWRFRSGPAELPRPLGSSSHS